MSYGVNTSCAAQPGRARAAGSSRRASTRTATRRKAASARSAKRTSRKKAKKRRSLQPGGSRIPRGWGGTLAQYKAYEERQKKGGPWTEATQGRWL